MPYVCFWVYERREDPSQSDEENKKEKVRKKARDVEIDREAREMYIHCKKNGEEEESE